MSEVVTIKKTPKGVWMKRFDDHEPGFSRISEAEAIESITEARRKGAMFSDDDENVADMPLVFGYYN